MTNMSIAVPSHPYYSITIYGGGDTYIGQIKRNYFSGILIKDRFDRVKFGYHCLQPSPRGSDDPANAW